MSSIWLPEQSPPQLESTITDEMIDSLLLNGLTRVYKDTLPVFSEVQPYLKDYVKAIELENLDDTRPLTVVQASSAITTLAYFKSGYQQVVDPDCLAVGQMDAALEGIPDAYVTSFLADPELTRLVGAIAACPEFLDGGDEYNYPKLLEISAGWVRHSMQYAVAA